LTMWLGLSAFHGITLHHGVSKTLKYSVISDRPFKWRSQIFCLPLQPRTYEDNVCISSASIKDECDGVNSCLIILLWTPKLLYQWIVFSFKLSTIVTYGSKGFHFIYTHIYIFMRILFCTQVYYHTQVLSHSSRPSLSLWQPRVKLARRKSMQVCGGYTCYQHLYYSSVRLFRHHFGSSPTDPRSTTFRFTISISPGTENNSPASLSHARIGQMPVARPIYTFGILELSLLIRMQEIITLLR
jgi:hypothetical protein